MSAATPTYAFIKKISLPTGDAKWDYLKMNGEQERLYVSHGDRVHVVDLRTEAQIGEIAGLKGVHGIALAKALHKGYISNGGDNAITSFDDKTFKVLKTLMVEGKKADAIYFDKVSNRVFVFNNGSGNVIAIDAATDGPTGRPMLPLTGQLSNAPMPKRNGRQHPRQGRFGWRWPVLTPTACFMPTLPG